MRVLVVEDQPDLSRLLRGFLEDAGYAVDSASDGSEGFAKAMTWPYDVIVLDLMLPKMAGLTLLEQMRTKRKTPVLILSALDALPDRVRGLDLGADDYLSKPFEREELLDGFGRLSVAPPGNRDRRSISMMYRSISVPSR